MDSGTGSSTPPPGQKVFACPADQKKLFQNGKVLFAPGMIFAVLCLGLALTARSRRGLCARRITPLSHFEVVNFMTLAVGLTLSGLPSLPSDLPFCTTPKTVVAAFFNGLLGSWVACLALALYRYQIRVQYVRDEKVYPCMAGYLIFLIMISMMLAIFGVIEATAIEDRFSHNYTVAAFTGCTLAIVCVVGCYLVSSGAGQCRARDQASGRLLTDEEEEQRIGNAARADRRVVHESDDSTGTEYVKQLNIPGDSVSTYAAAVAAKSGKVAPPPPPPSPQEEPPNVTPPEAPPADDQLKPPEDGVSEMTTMSKDWRSLAKKKRRRSRSRSRSRSGSRRRERSRSKSRSRSKKSAASDW